MEIILLVKLLPAELIAGVEFHFRSAQQSLSFFADSVSHQVQEFQVLQDLRNSSRRVHLVF